MRTSPAPRSPLESTRPIAIGTLNRAGCGGTGRRGARPRPRRRRRRRRCSAARRRQHHRGGHRGAREGRAAEHAVGLAPLAAADRPGHERGRPDRHRGEHRERHEVHLARDRGRGDGVAADLRRVRRAEPGDDDRAHEADERLQREAQHRRPGERPDADADRRAGRGRGLAPLDDGLGAHPTSSRAALEDVVGGAVGERRRRDLRRRAERGREDAHVGDEEARAPRGTRRTRSRRDVRGSPPMRAGRLRVGRGQRDRVRPRLGDAAPRDRREVVAGAEARAGRCA